METSQEGLAKKNKNNKFRQNELLPNAHTVHMRGSVCLVYYQKCEFNFQLVVHSTKSQCQVKECVEFVIFVFLFKWLLCIYIQIARPSLFPPLLFYSTDIHRGKSSNNQHRLPHWRESKWKIMTETLQMRKRQIVVPFTSLTVTWCNFSTWTPKDSASPSPPPTRFTIHGTTATDWQHCSCNLNWQNQSSSMNKTRNLALLFGIIIGGGHGKALQVDVRHPQDNDLCNLNPSRGPEILSQLKGGRKKAVPKLFQITSTTSPRTWFGTTHNNLLAKIGHLKGIIRMYTRGIVSDDDEEEVDNFGLLSQFSFKDKGSNFILNFPINNLFFLPSPVALLWPTTTRRLSIVTPTYSLIVPENKSVYRRIQWI